MARRGFSLKNSKLITKLLVLVYHIIFQVLEMIEHKHGILKHPTKGLHLAELGAIRVFILGWVPG